MENGSCDTIINTFENFDQSKINILGTYSGGCGNAYLAKKRILEETKSLLNKDYFIDSANINVFLVDLKTKNEQYLNNLYLENTIFRHNEFNIFMFYKNKKFLIGSSYASNKDAYYEYLQGALGVSKSEFYNNFITKIYSIIEDIDKKIK